MESSLCPRDTFTSHWTPSGLCVCVCVLKGQLTSAGGRGLGKPPQLWVISKDHCWDSLA